MMGLAIVVVFFLGMGWYWWALGKGRPLHEHGKRIDRRNAAAYVAEAEDELRRARNWQGRVG